MVGFLANMIIVIVVLMVVGAILVIKIICSIIDESSRRKRFKEFQRKYPQLRGGRWEYDDYPWELIMNRDGEMERKGNEYKHWCDDYENQYNYLSK